MIFTVTDNRQSKICDRGKLKGQTPEIREFASIHLLKTVMIFTVTVKRQSKMCEREIKGTDTRNPGICEYIFTENCYDIYCYR
jgi:hypothetical protein